MEHLDLLKRATIKVRGKTIEIRELTYAQAQMVAAADDATRGLLVVRLGAFPNSTDEELGKELSLAVVIEIATAIQSLSMPPEAAEKK